MNLTSQGVGTYWYLPPECFLTGQNEEDVPKISQKVDIFSVGVIFYELVFGKKPFGHNMSQERIFKEQIMLTAKEVKFPSSPLFSKEGQEFVKKLLAKNQDVRLSAEEAYSHPYLKRK